MVRARRTAALLRSAASGLYSAMESLAKAARSAAWMAVSAKSGGQDAVKLRGLGGGMRGFGDQFRIDCQALLGQPTAVGPDFGIVVIGCLLGVGVGCRWVDCCKGTGEDWPAPAWICIAMVSQIGGSCCCWGGANPRAGGAV